MKKSTKDQKKNTQDICQVCLTNNPQDKVKPRTKQAENQRKKALELYQCSTCKCRVHKYCYDPSLHDLKSFKCDICKHIPKGKQQKKPVCFICQCDGAILKYIEDNKFIHIQCGLTSDMVILQNFKTLKFKINNDYKPKQLSASKEKGNKESAPKCAYCEKNNQQGLFNCFQKGCDYHCHIYCLLNHKYKQNKIEEDVIFNLLDKCQGAFRVKNFDFLKRNYLILKGVDLLSKSKRSIDMVTCQGHCSLIKWCSQCFAIGDPTAMSQCSRCLRWVHNACSVMQNKSGESYFECNSCIKNNKFLMRARFPELIYNMVQIQTSPSKWTEEQIKYIDCFAFKSSVEIYNQILVKNKQQFEYYQLYRYLQKQFLQGFDFEKTIQKILQKIDNKIVKDVQNKKIIQILYYLKYKELKRLSELNTANDINDLKDVYPVKRQKRQPTRAAEQDKCRKILIKILDTFISNIKQAQLKDISIKFVEFADKVRKQISNIKQNHFIPESYQTLKKQERLKKISELLRGKPQQIALDLRELFKMISVNKDKLRNKFENENNKNQDFDQNNQSENKVSKSSKNKLSLNNNFLMTLIRCIIAKEQNYETQHIGIQDLEDLINSYRKIIFISRLTNSKVPRKLTLSEEQFYKILNKSYDLKKTRLSQQSRVKISKFFKTLIKQNKIKQTYELKSQLAQKYDQLISQDRLNYKQVLVMKESIAEQGLFIDKHSKILNLQKRSTYYKVLKIKYMKIVNLQIQQQKNSQYVPLKINEKNRKDILENVKRLLQANNKSILLNQKQKTDLQYFVVKQQVFADILREQLILGARLNDYDPEKIENSNILIQNGSGIDQAEKIVSPKISNPGQLSVLQRIKRIFNFWIRNNVDSPYQIIKTISPIAQKNIKFSLDFQQAFNNLIQSIGTRYNFMFSSQSHIAGPYNGSHRVNSDQFMKLWKLIQYTELQNAFEKLKYLSEQYKLWAQDLQTRFNPIEKVLEDKFLNTELLQVIDRKILEAERFQIDLKTEVKKLKIVKLWVVLSQKFQKDFERKPTIGAIQQFKALMIKINYPKNQIYQKVLDLESYGRLLNQRIQKYLKKTKQQDLQFYEQICIINSKMSLKQAEALKTQLENSKLDVSAQLQQLDDEIINFNEIPTKLESNLKKLGNIEELVKIKNKILDTPLKYQNLEGYCQLIHRINFLKCQNLQGTVTKKQFFRLLNTSDLGAIILTQKMPMLMKAYRQIDRAQKQILQPKPKYEHMLPQDGKKLKNQLLNDPNMLEHIQKVYKKVESLRQKFKDYRIRKVEYDKYVLLEYQLSHYPVTYKDISTQIARMKKQLDNIVDRASMMKKNFNPKQTNQIVRSYGKIGIKSEELEQLRKIYEEYLLIQELSQDKDDYIQFSHKCRAYHQFSSMIFLNESRTQLFEEYSDQILDQKRSMNDIKSPIAFLHALIYQGTHLLHYTISNNKYNSRQKILDKLLKLNKKVQTITSGGPSSSKKQRQKVQEGENQGEQDYDDFDQDQDQYDDSQSYDDQQKDEMDGYGNQEDEQDMIDDQFDDQYDEEDQEDSIPNPPPKKRSQPLVMQISDEQNEPQPEIRKITHITPIQASGQTPNEAGQIISESQQVQNVSQSQKQ